MLVHSEKGLGYNKPQNEHVYICLKKSWYKWAGAEPKAGQPTFHFTQQIIKSFMNQLIVVTYRNLYFINQIVFL